MKVVFLVALALVSCAVARNVLMDDFELPTRTFRLNVEGVFDDNAQIPATEVFVLGVDGLDPTTVIGGARRMTNQVTGGTSESNAAAKVGKGCNACSDGTMSWSIGTGVRADLHIFWDGSGGDSPVVNPEGLNGYDLTEGGIQTQFAIEVKAIDLEGEITLRVYGAGGAASEFSFDPRNFFSTAEGQESTALISFGEFGAAAGASGAVDFTSIGAIELQVPPQATVDLALDSFYTVGNCGDCPAPRVQDPDTCECTCPTSCPTFQVQDPVTCQCSCPDACIAPKVQNPADCTCSCGNACADPFVQSPATCACNCPNACLPPFVRDATPGSCACVCPNTCTGGKTQLDDCSCVCPNTCEAPLTQDPEDCQCSCPSGECRIAGCEKKFKCSTVKINFD